MENIICTIAACSIIKTFSNKKLHVNVEFFITYIFWIDVICTQVF